MSDILEALRKVELQRNNSKVPGITTRQRYYTARSKHAWMRPAFILAAGFIGALLSAVFSIYLTRNTGEVPPSADAPKAKTTAVPTASMVVPPVALKESARDLPLVRPSYKEQEAATQTTLPTALTTPPRLPAPRRHNEALLPSANKSRVTQSAQPVRPQPQQEKGEKPSEEEPTPETREPASPVREEGTSVASAAVVEQAIQPVSRTGVVHNRSVYNTIPRQAAEALDQIKPPAGVEVKPFRPNDVIRPPAARKAQPADSEPPLLSTLSSQFQSMVPKMTINAQVYSTTQPQRFVVINMKRYNEGQKTAEGVTIEAIRKNDIVFVYQGQQFRMGR